MRCNSVGPRHTISPQSEEVPMDPPPYRALRVLLRVFALLAAVGGAFMTFAEKSLIVRIFLAPPEAQVSTLLLAMVKEVGGFTLTFSLLLWSAARDPVRNVAVLDALIVGLCVLAVTPLLSLWTTDIR